MSAEPNETALLLRRAQTGDRAAFDRLLGRVRPALWAHALHRTSGDAHEADDITQEICVRVWRGFPQLQNPAVFWAWLQTVAASVYSDRLRQNTRRPKYALLDATSDLPTQNNDALPLGRLLHRERQRELSRALDQLPRANREALVWHVWGGCSYQEIADLAGVPATTVEGRIYRAKQQMRRLLLPKGAFLFAPTNADPPQRRKVIMPASAPANVSISPAAPARLPLSLVLFAQRFAALIDGGVSLAAALDALSDLPEPYGEAAQELARRVSAGEIPSRIMNERAELWGTAYIALVRVGEVGGILEEALRLAARLLTREYQLIQRQNETPFLLAPPSALPAAWDTQTTYQQTVTRLLFCQCAAILLGSGVPLTRVLSVCAVFLPAPLRADLSAAVGGDAAAAAVPDAAALLAPLGIFDRFVLTLLQTGQANGTLDLAFHKAGEALEQELSCF